MHQGSLLMSDRSALRPRLVSVLYESVELCSDRRWSPALVRLFLDTLQPLLAIVNGWTLLETDPDPAQEFLIQR